MTGPDALPLLVDAADLGLRRIVVPSSVGDIVVRAGLDGGGPATLLLHGAAGSWTTWTPLLSSAARDGAALSDVVAMDLPGWGESDGLARVRSVSGLADAVAEAVRGLGYDAWHVVGHSLGGFLALDLAARHPGSTASVTLVSPSGPAVVDAIRRPVHGGLAVPGFAGMLLIMRALAALGPLGRRLVRAVDRWGGMPPLTAPLFRSAVHPSVVAAFADEVRPAAFATAARFAAAYDLSTWSRVSCPVSWVRGERDVFAGRPDTAALRSLIADLSEVRLPDAGHFAHIERPDAVRAAMSAARRRQRREIVTRRGVSASRSSPCP